MPEIGEVARVVHFIRQYLAGKQLAEIKTVHDENVYGKVGTSAAEVEKALSGKRIIDARQQGKYFWLVMSSPPHLLMHFGMAGWFHIRGVPTVKYKPSKESTEWPPKYWKFSLKTTAEPGLPEAEAAFVDFRRFGRVRLVNCPADEMRTTTPLKENGPDPVIDREIFTEAWLVKKCKGKKVPIKALLLDQANVSGIGNWVGDEIMYNARIHPEQYCNTLSDAQFSTLYKSICYVTSLAVDTLADSAQFPKDWLFKHRWGKGKNDAPKLMPNGAKIIFLTVGGRTSAVVPGVQKKTGSVAADVKEPEDRLEESGQKIKEMISPKKTPKKRKRAVSEEEEEEDSEDSDGDVEEYTESESEAEERTKKASRPIKKSISATPLKNGSRAKAAAKSEGQTPKRKTARVKKASNREADDTESDNEDDDLDDGEENTEPVTKKAKNVSKAAPNGSAKKVAVKKSTLASTDKIKAKIEKVEEGSRRRSNRVSGGTR